MQLPPASVIASWPAQNLVNPERRGPASLIVMSILLAIVTALLGIRLYTRTRISKGFGVDDVLIVLAYIPATAFVAAGIYAQVKLDWDRHIWDLNLDLTTPGLQTSLAVEVLFGTATTLTKLSMVALLYRLTAADGSRFRYLVLAVGGVIAVDGTVFIFVLLLQCRPLYEYWTLSVGPQNCINEAVHLLTAGIINTTTDFVLVLLPIPTVLKLELPVRQRVVVYLLFTGGLLASAAGGVRTYFTWVMLTSYDITWNAYLVVLLSSLELYIGIICASIPATKPFFRRYIPQLLASASWTDLTEPLAERSKTPNMRSSFSTDADVEAAAIPIHGRRRNESKMTMPIMSPWSMALSPDLNKPLPKIRVTIDRTFSWGQTSSRVSGDGETIVVGLRESLGRPASSIMSPHVASMVQVRRSDVMP